jgi:hypothetical protein
MIVKLIQIDGELPNLALMKLAYHYKAIGAEVSFSHSVKRDLFEPVYDFVLASAIFQTSWKKIELLKDFYPNAIVGGTAVSKKREDTVENFLGIAPDYKYLDYSFYPEFEYSIGMTHLGCSSSCGFCCVGEKEGSNRPLSNINEIWRGEPYPKKLILLDNDFQNRLGWQSICQEIIDGNFEVAFIQGMNLRKLTDEHIDYFKQIKFRDKNFQKKRFYCAWDNEKDIKKIERGLHILEQANIQRSTVTPYFLCNYFRKGLTEDVWNRFLFMAERDLRPYAMIFEKWTLPPNDDLKIFQNWVNSHNAYANPTKEGFAEYKNYYQNRNKIYKEKQAELFI